MKTTVVKTWILIAIVVFGLLSPLSAAFVTLTNPSINPKPLDRVENNGVGIITLGLVETSNAVAPATDALEEPNIIISLEMNKVKLIGDDVSNITGTLMNYFSASYNAVDKRIIFSQIADFPGYGDVSVSIPVDVTINTKSTDNSLNGFNANISANDADTVADGNAAEFTFTKLQLEAVNDSATSTTSGGVAIANIVSNDTLDNAPATLTAVNITNVTNNTVLVVDTETGSVTVPVGAADGTYIETYTICELATPSNCDDANITITIGKTLPDYEVAVSVSQAVFINDTGTFNTIIRVAEQLHGINTGDIVYSINKNNNMTLSYDNALTSMDGVNLSNSDWEWTETASTYRLRYIGTGTIFPAFKRMYIGIVGTFMPPVDAKGKFPLTIKLRGGSGDTDPNNNEDVEMISYSSDS